MNGSFAKIALLLSVAAVPALAEDCPIAEEVSVEIGHARLFIEDNAADGDIGVHGLFDSHGWSVLCVFAPDGQKILSFEPQGSLGDLGIAGFFFESNEPEYSNWGYADLIAAFPEGQYIVRGRNLDGTALTGSANFTTIVPLRPAILTPQTVKDDEGDLPTVPFADLLVSWEQVTESRDGRPVTIAGYEVILVNEDYEGSDDSFAQPTYDVHVGPDRSELLVPVGFFDPSTTYEIEVIAIEVSGNQTIAGASFFRTGE